jgi:ribosomal protein S27AE
MDTQRQEKIVKALELKVSRNCPRCDWPEFEVIGEASIPLVAEQGRSWFGPPPALPIILVSCKNCGFLAQHTRRLLDL